MDHHLKFIVVSFCSGTYGNLLCQKLVKLRPEFFKLKNMVDEDVLMTADGFRYYHNCAAFFEDLFYTGDASYAFLDGTEDLIAVRKQILDHPDYHKLSHTQYNIVKTHMFTDTELRQLAKVLGPETIVAQIGFRLDNVPEIADRFIRVMQEINHNTPNITMGSYSQMLLDCMPHVNQENLVFDFNELQRDEYITAVLDKWLTK